MNSNWIILAIVILGGSALGYNTWYKQQMAHGAQPTSTVINEPVNKTTLIGQRRPGFTLKDMIGLPRELDEWDGQVIVLNFWATWCRPCLTEIPMFSDVQAAMTDNNVVFIGIAIDDRGTVETFLERTGIKLDYQILIGDDDAIPVAVAYGNDTGILPYTVIIDTQGRVAFFHYGAISREELVAELERAIKKDLGLRT